MATSKSQFKGLLLQLTGDKAMARRLERMAHGVGSNIARRAVLAAIRVIAKAQKAAAPTPQFRRAIGSRVGKNKHSLLQEAKAGLNVAKPWHRMIDGKSIRNTAIMPQGHLLILGTKDRWTGHTTRASGRRGKLTSTGKPIAFRGRIHPMANQFIRQATASSKSAAIQAARVSAWDAIAREAAKG